MRQLKHHEKKLLRKVDLYSWKKEDNLRVAQVLRRYHIQDPTDYQSYNRICGMIGKLSAKLKTLKADDPFRIAMTDQLLTKLHNMGLIDTTKSLQKAEDMTTSALCRRRIPVVMVSKKSWNVHDFVQDVGQTDPQQSIDLPNDRSRCIGGSPEAWIR